MIYFLSLVILLGLVSLLLMVLSGCDAALLTFLVRRNLVGEFPPSGGVAALVSAVNVRPPAVGWLGSGAASSLGNIEGDGREKIRLTKKTDVRLRFGVDPWEAANSQTLEG